MRLAASSSCFFCFPELKTKRRQIPPWLKTNQKETKPRRKTKTSNALKCVLRRLLYVLVTFIFFFRRIWLKSHRSALQRYSFLTKQTTKTKHLGNTIKTGELASPPERARCEAKRNTRAWFGGCSRVLDGVHPFLWITFEKNGLSTGGFLARTYFLKIYINS